MSRGRLQILTTLATLLVMFAFVGSGGAQDGAESADPGARRPFIHLDHVPTVWANGSLPEVPRDCRGCHQFGETSTRDPQAVCSECHIQAYENGNQFQVQFNDGWETLDPHRSPDSMFQHYAHRELTCRECHQPADEIPSDPMPIRRGSQECIRCHGAGVSSEPLELDGMMGEPMVETQAARGKMVNLLNDSPAMQAGTLGAFFHSEHLAGTSQEFSLAQLVSEDPMEGRCTSCHEPIIESGIEGFQAKRFKEDTCGTCHITKAGPMSFATTQEAATSIAGGTFSHSDHLGYRTDRHNPSLSNEAGYRRIEESGCHACHQYDSEARTFTVENAATHADCRSCHDAEPWSVEQHGDWEAWGCMSCHSFDVSGGLAVDRPLVEVKRRVDTRFIVQSQVHPHIAGEDKTTVYEGNCIQCHRAPVRELPSRIGEREFSHGTHLPANPSAEDCARCHGSRIGSAETSLAIAEHLNGVSLLEASAGQKDQLGLTFDTAACAECHRGGVLQPVQTEYTELTTRAVPEFSHAHHLGKDAADGRPLDCTSCHQTDGVSGAPVATPVGVMDCTQCHGHAEGFAGDISGQASALEISRCDTCHVGPIPATGREPVIERLRISATMGDLAQFHPMDRECNECHKADWDHFGESGTMGGDHVFASLGRSLAPTGDVLRHQHRGRGVDRELQDIYGATDGFLRNRGGIGCHWCHWTKGITAYDFESANTREKYGNLLKEVDKDGNEHVWPGGNYNWLYSKDRTPR